MCDVCAVIFPHILDVSDCICRLVSFVSGSDIFVMIFSHILDVSDCMYKLVSSVPECDVCAERCLKLGIVESTHHLARELGSPLGLFLRRARGKMLSIQGKRFIFRGAGTPPS